MGWVELCAMPQRECISLPQIKDDASPMNDEHTIRAVLMVVLLLVLPIGLYHRLTSQATREKLDRRQEGLFILATLRPVGLAFWLAVIAWMIDPRWMAWSSLSLPAWLRWTGVGVMATACLCQQR